MGSSAERRRTQRTAADQSSVNVVFPILSSTMIFWIAGEEIPMMRVMSESKPGKSRVDLNKQMAEIVRLREEMRAKTPEQRRTTTRAVARILDDVHLEGRMGKFVVEADEPLARGGTDLGPSPLQYLMMGTAF